jgi:hypothetical protein
MELKTGDVLLVHHHFAFHWKRIAQSIIRMLTVSSFDHASIVLIEDGKTFVVEAQFDLGITKVPFEQWLLDGKKTVVVSRRDIPVPAHIMSSLVNMYVDRKPYDYLALWQQLWYQMSRRLRLNIPWFGRTENGKASDRFYCSEFVAFVHDLEDWWMMTPDDLFDHPEFRPYKMI